MSAPEFSATLPRPRYFTLFATLALLLHALGMLHFRATAAGGSDSSGYLNLARMLARGESLRALPAAVVFGLGLPREIYIPLGFVAGPAPSALAPYYPTGFPLHLAVFGLLLGFQLGPFLVSPLAATVAVWLLYHLGRRLGLSRAEGVAAAVILALHPVHVFLGLQPMSDVVATCWATAAVLAAISAQQRTAWAWAAGAAFAVAVLVRPTNLLLFPVLLWALPLTLRAHLRFVLAGLPFLAFLLAFNHSAYGHPLHNGYGSLESEIALEFFTKRWHHYTHWLGRTSTPLVAVAWLLVGIRREVAARIRGLLLTWFAVYFFFYCFYRSYDSWWYLRFLLPAFPAMILAAVLAARPVWQSIEVRIRLSKPAWTSLNLLPWLVLAVILVREVKNIDREHVLAIAAGEAIYPRGCRMAAAVVPEPAIVLSMQMSGALTYYTDLTVLRYDHLPPATYARLRPQTDRLGYAWYALLHRAEIAQFERQAPGIWKPVGEIDNALLLAMEPP